MEPPISPLLFSLLLFVGMLILLEGGRRLGISQRSGEPESERASLGTIEGSLFALFGLVVAFTFSGAASRFNEKRALIAEEVNHIETAYLRLELLPADARSSLQDLFRQYVDSRVATYRKLPDMKAAEVEIAKSKALQAEIWTKAVAASSLSKSHPDAGKLLLPALNNMIDVTTTRRMALEIHPPRIIYALVFGLALICSLLAGYRMADSLHRSWVHIFGFTVISVIVIYVILDIEYPRSGLIRLEAPDHVLLNVRESLR
jgi:hypothetical protein